MKTTAKAEILRVLAASGHPLAVHEFGIVGYSENCLATRLSELHAEGKVVRRTRLGAAFKEWRLANAEEREYILKNRTPINEKLVVTGKVEAVESSPFGELWDRVVINVPTGTFRQGQQVRFA